MFIELGCSGHRLDYLRRLLTGLADRQVRSSVVFVLTPDFKDSLDGDLVTAARRKNRVDIVYTTDVESRRCQSKTGIWRRLNRSLVLERYLKRTGAQLGFVNYLDPMLPGLGIPFRRRGPVIAGILFRPTIHYAALHRESAQSAEHSSEARHLAFQSRIEKIVYRMSIRNPRLATILSLDPIFPDFAMSHYRGGSKVRRLAEPYSGPTSLPHTSKSTDRVTFLLFGSITRRKGLRETLMSLGQLSPEEANKMRLVIAGRIQNDFKAEVHGLAAAAKRQLPELEMEIRDEFIPDRELNCLIKESDVILAPYRRHVGSSGVLVMAAHHNRPVISQSYGLMGALVERYDLGIACDPENHADLARCLRQALDKGPHTLGDPSGMAAYAAANNDELFLEGVFDAAGLDVVQGQNGPAETTR